MKSNHFANKTAIVTGAASGIGRALALELATRGAIVYAADRDESRLAGLTQANPTGNIHLVHLDITDPAAVTAVVERVAAECGRLDLMFNNAGIVVGGDFADLPTDIWQRIVDVNFWGVVHGTRAAYSQMRRQGWGHIVNTSSSAGVIPVARSVAYTATKHAVVGLSTSLRAEAAEHGIFVSVVLPGLVDTNIFSDAINLANYNYSAAVERVPMKKISPHQAARSILRGVTRNDEFIVFPALNRLVIRLYRVMPKMIGPIIARAGM